MKKAQRLRRFFSPVVIIYCILVAVVVLFILYIAFNKTVITVTLKSPPIQYDFTYSAEEVSGTVISKPIIHEYTFTDYEAIEEEGTARGKVTIINNYSVDQPLVETTRLLSEFGVLFRTDETVTVPAGGKVDVPVYADQPGANGNIDASTFEIVALWEGLKDKIYAESFVAMSGGIVKRVTMTEDIVENAKDAADDDFQTYVVDLMNKEASATTEKLTMDSILIEDQNRAIRPAIGETDDAVVVTTTGSASVIVIPKEKLMTLISDVVGYEVSTVEAMTTRMPDGELILTGNAELPATKVETDFIDPALLTNRTPQQVQEQLFVFDEVADVTVQLSPAWATRTPALEQQIHLRFEVESGENVND